MNNLLRESAILNWFTLYLRRRALRRKFLGTETVSPARRTPWYLRINFLKFFQNSFVSKISYGAILLSFGLLMIFGTSRLVGHLVAVSAQSWGIVIEGTLFTLLRVFGVILLGSLWAVPTAVWIGTNGKRLRIAQPIIQILASFPAPMLYPLALGFFLWAQIPFSVGSMLLMLLGSQWYILFNVLAGAMRIPKELDDAMNVIGSSRTQKWFKLYLPSVFPSLVSGWVTAAGGAWNASIVAEYLYYEGQLISTPGLGSVISQAAFSKDFTLLAASLTVMVAVVVILNRSLWAKVYHLAQTRYRLDLY